MTTFRDYSRALLNPIEDELKQTLYSGLRDDYPELNLMLGYHMGWEGAGAGPKAQGKRIRPLLLLLSAIATGNDWHEFLPLSAAVELIHNFSLIHDDIEDNSFLRRGRETLWIKWGIPQAINAGDLMFTVANLAVVNHCESFGPNTCLDAARLLHQTCIRLTQGQFLDMHFEKREIVSSDEYLAMIDRKTAALLSCCTELGAIKSPPPIRKAMREFGHSLGLAFQIQDDILGLWGDTSLTGKSVETDLTSGKKTFPILFAIQNNPTFCKRWQSGLISASEAANISMQLKMDGTYTYTKSLVEKYTSKAAEHLRSTNFSNEAVGALLEIAGQLVERKN